MESSFLNIDVEELKGTRSKDFDNKLFHELEVACTGAFLLNDLVLCIRVEKDGEYLSHISKKVLVDTFIPNDVCLELLQLEFLSVFVQDCLRGSRLDPHGHR